MVESVPVFASDYQLWQSFKAGDERAFDKMYEMYFAKLYGYGTRFSRDKAMVKDCIQSLFVDLWNSRATLGDVHFIKNYLYTCLRRKIIKELQSVHQHLSAEEVDDTYHFEVNFSHELFMINDQITRENHSKVIQAFHSLTRRQQEAIFLRFYENLEYPEIAEIMALKEVKYARTLIYRALEVMKGSIRTLASSS